jgi:Fe-S cluster assembly ATP-binding protein
MLKIQKLVASIDEKQILKNLNLTVEKGEIHVIMGRNGAGKSTLASVLMGDPDYQVHSGQALLNGEDLLKMEVDERAKAGLFLAFQYPMEIPGITVDDFIYNALETKNQNQFKSNFSYNSKMDQAVQDLKMMDDIFDRHVNVGFSGGEKKRNEILQMKMLSPSLAILDEIDSGLDIDALKIVCQNINQEMKERKDELSIIIITHYRKLLDYINPDYVHIMSEGEIIKSGGIELADQLEEEGYNQVERSVSSICGMLGDI